MIKELKLSNFRLFDDEVTIRFRPITVLIGKNNAGKSSVIYFLRMLQRTLRSGGQFLNTKENRKSGSDLGYFSDLKNKKSKQDGLKFSVTVGANATPANAVAGLLEKVRKKGKWWDKLRFTSRADITYNQNNKFVGEKQEVEVSYLDEPPHAWQFKIRENDVWLQFITTPGGEIENLEALNAASEVIRLDLDKIRHISAVRSDLERAFYAPDSSPDHVGYVGMNGEYTLQEFHNSIYADRSKMRLLKKHAKEVLGISKIRFSSNGDLTSCYATNVHTGAEVNIAHYGYGVSQCLPLCVQGLLSSHHDQLMIEQPEVHVHPTAQLKLGSLIADLWHVRKVRTIVETHSANILLRFRRLVTSGELNPDDISVAYFSFDGGRATVENLEIDRSGKFSPDLPMQFFGADLLETVNMNLGEPPE